MALPKVLVIDFETILDPRAVPFIPEKGPRDRSDPMEKVAFDSNYIMPCVAGFGDGARVWSIGQDMTDHNESKLLKEIWAVIGQYDQFVTFNGNSFDIPLLYKRSWFAGVKPTAWISLKRYDPTTNHTDVRALLGNWDQYARGNLDLYGALKLGLRKTDGIDGSMVQGMWDRKEYGKVHDYCKDDVALTWELYRSLLGYYLPEPEPQEENLQQGNANPSPCQIPF